MYIHIYILHWHIAHYKRAKSYFFYLWPADKFHCWSVWNKLPIYLLLGFLTNIIILLISIFCWLFLCIYYTAFIYCLAYVCKCLALPLANVPPAFPVVSPIVFVVDVTFGNSRNSIFFEIWHLLTHWTTSTWAENYNQKSRGFIVNNVSIRLIHKTHDWDDSNFW